MQLSISDGPYVDLALLALLVFLLVPNRYLNAGHWGRHCCSTHL